MHRALSATVVSAVLLPPSAIAQVHTDGALLQDFGPTGHDMTNAVAFAPSGAIYAGGRTGARDLFVMKFDSAGNPLWTRTWTGGGTGIDSAYGLAVVPSDESVYAVGRMDPLSGSTQGLIVKYDSSGVLQWAASTGPAGGTSQLYEAVVRPNGNVVAAGGSGAGLAWVTEYTPQGTPLWLTTVPNGEYPSEIVLDAAGNAIVSGSWDETASGSKFGVAKFSPAGAFLWLRLLTNGTGNEAAHRVLPDASGAIYAVGRLIDPVAGPRGVLVKLDADGNVVWSRGEQGTETGPTAGASLSGLSRAPNGNLRAVGRVTNTGAEGDLRAVDYTPDGVRTWSAEWNGPLGMDEAFVGSHTDSDGALVVAGRSEAIWGGFEPVVVR